MNSFLEIAELGVKQDIPIEMSKLTGENSLLRTENNKLKGIIKVAGVLVGIYLFRKYVWPWLINKNPEDE